MGEIINFMKKKVGHRLGADWVQVRQN